MDVKNTVKKILIIFPIWLLCGCNGGSGNNAQQNLSTATSQAQQKTSPQTTPADKSHTSNMPKNNILPGMGYASDTLQVAPTVCYNPLTNTIGNKSSYINMQTSTSVQQISNILNISVDIGASYFGISGNEFFNYLNSIQDDSYSSTLNYTNIISGDNSITYSYDPHTILTPTGVGIYNNGQNPLFRILCGDKLITSYKTGAVLIMSLKVKFASAADKQEFDNKFSAGVVGLGQITTAIQSISTQYNLNGQVTISGYQLGGDPTQLGRMLNSSILQCSITNTAACRQAETGLLNYSSNIFPSQFNGSSWTNMATLGGFTTGYLVSDLGLRLAPTYVTPEVVTARQTLINQYDDHCLGLTRIQ